MKLGMTEAWELEGTGSGGAEHESALRSSDALSAWMICGTSMWSSLDDERFDCLQLLGPGTTNGWFRWVDDPPASQTALSELRQRTQLTWAQLARMLGVQRRSLHFWARGERPSASNLERLMRIVGIVRAVDRGDPGETTSVLLEPRRSGVSAFTLLCEGKDAEVAELLSLTVRERQQSAGPRRQRPPRLDRAERERRRGLSPVERTAAIGDDTPSHAGRLLASVEVPGGSG